jgi:peptidoglycan/LPS O-acetylase OafA/YrhL
MKYRREVDGLRAVAVLPVILFHAGFSVFSGGFVGVDVFFVISGYLITSILMAELEKGDFSIARFYERRARRILPALFVVMLACLPFAYMWMMPLQLKDFAASVVSVVFSLSNLFFISQVNYFAPDAYTQPLLHTWSLAIEEQYYFLFPLMLMAMRKISLRTTAFLIFLLVLVSFIFSEWAWRNDAARSFFFTLSRFWEIGVGSLCSFLTVGRSQRSSNLLSIAGLGLIVFAIFAYNENVPFPSVYALAPVVGTALVLLFADEGTWVGQLLSLRAFVGIGLISYSAYLWHQPLFAFARLRSLTEPNQVLMAALAVVALLLAWVTWRYVEQPFRKRTNPIFIMRRSVFAASGIVGALFVAVGLAGHLGNGFEWRFNAEERLLLQTATSSPMRNACHYGKGDNLATFKFCEYFDGQVTTAVYGNSHAVELAFALAEKLQEKGQAVAQFSISGCKPSFKNDTEEYCDTFYQNRLSYLIQNKQLRNVVVTYRAENAGESGADSIVNLANYLAEQGRNVVLVIQAPTLERDISSYIHSAIAMGVHDVGARTKDEWLEINQNVYAALYRLHPSVHVVDLANYFCDFSMCFAVRNGVALYFDDDHMSVSGARLVAKYIIQYLD